MINLHDYLFKTVVLTTVGNEVHQGFVDMYCSSEDDEDDPEDSIGIISNRHSKEGLIFYQSDIKTIEIVE